jgi:hypothetical protein
MSPEVIRLTGPQVSRPGYLVKSVPAGQSRDTRKLLIYWTIRSSFVPFLFLTGIQRRADGVGDQRCGLGRDFTQHAVTGSPLDE